LIGAMTTFFLLRGDGMAQLNLKLNDGTAIHVPITAGPNVSTSAPLSSFHNLPNGGYNVVTHQNVTITISDTPLIDFASTIANQSSTPFTVGALSCNYIRTSVNDPTTLQFGNTSIDGSTCGHKTSTVNYQKLCAVQFDVEGVTMIALGAPPIGSTGLGSFNYLWVVSSDALGKAAFAPKGGEETPPNDGVDSGAGYGLYNYISDQASGSAMPTRGAIPVSASGHGHHLYRMTAAALQQLGEHLWGRGSVSDKVAAISDLWQRWQNYKFTPIAGIISCMQLPDALTPVSTSSDVGVRLAGTHVPIDGTITGCTWIDSKPIAAQKVIDADIPAQYGSWLDFEGVSITLILPFIGRVDISPSACIDGHIQVDYQCDPLNGNVAALIWTTDRWGYRCLYQQATGNCAVQVPLTGQSDGMIPMIGSQLSGIVSGAISAATGNAAGVISSAVAIARGAMQDRDRLQTAGNYAGSAAFVGSTQAAVIITYSHPTSSPNYDHVKGRPSEYGAAVGDYSGFTVFHDIDVNIPRATEAECREIKQLLESGVIL
jgi:hypothetical protein